MYRPLHSITKFVYANLYLSLLTNPQVQGTFIRRLGWGGVVTINPMALVSREELIICSKADTKEVHIPCLTHTLPAPTARWTAGGCRRHGPRWIPNWPHY